MVPKRTGAWFAEHCTKADSNCKIVLRVFKNQSYLDVLHSTRSGEQPDPKYYAYLKSTKQIAPGDAIRYSYEGNFIGVGLSTLSKPETPQRSGATTLSKPPPKAVGRPRKRKCELTRDVNGHFEKKKKV